MELSYNSLLLILGFLWLAIAFQLGLSIRAWWIERREGMRLSLRRVTILSVVFATTTGLLLIGFFLPDAPIQSGEQTPGARQQETSSNNSQNVNTAKPGDAQTANTRLQLQEAQQELASLDKKRGEVQQKVNELQNLLKPPSDAAAAAANTSLPQNSGNLPQRPENVPASISRQSLVLVFIAVSGILFLAGFVALFAGGEIQTLFPAGWSITRAKSKNDSDPEKDLLLLTKAVWGKNYKEGWKIAERIREKRLNHLDRLDYLFLKAYCAFTLSDAEDEETNTEERRRLREQAITDLESVIEDAPNRGEALYLLGLMYGITDKNAEALEKFEKARESLKINTLPFDHNESVCLLRLGELALSKGDTEQAESYFQKVTKLGKLTDSVVDSRIRIGMIDLQNAVNRKDIATAKIAIARLEQIKGLKQQQQLQIEIVRAAFSARIALREGNANYALTQAETFLTNYLPKDLPKPDDEAADETLGSPIDESQLPFPHEVFRGFLFIQGVALSITETRNKSMLSEAQVERLKEPLLRALQFSPRQRDLLGALGGLVYWFRKDKRQKALEWLEAAATMGVSGRIVKKILEQDRLIEVERRHALDWFRSASSRLLRDPSLSNEVRTALKEELGRFQEFEALIVSLEEKPAFEFEEPTLEVIRERARYLLNLVVELSGRGQADRQVRLQKISADYSAYLQTLEHTTENIISLERRVFEELGDILEI